MTDLQVKGVMAGLGSEELVSQEDTSAWTALKESSLPPRLRLTIPLEFIGQGADQHTLRFRLRVTVEYLGDGTTLPDHSARPTGQQRVAESAP